MSGIVAGVQSGGCCCQPQGCTCSDPNRPGAIVDASITAISVEAELGIVEVRRSNGRIYAGCGPCPCRYSGVNGALGPVWGTGPSGPYYAYVPGGCIVDPDFTDGTECESLACMPGGCPCCPEYRISAVFGNQVLERAPAGSLHEWATVSRTVGDHAVGSWNWQPRQVGYCDATDGPLPNARVRRYCAFPLLEYSDGLAGPDPNGAFVDGGGNYTGGNVGLCAAYAVAGVSVPSANRCSYEAVIDIVYDFHAYRLGSIAQAGGTLVQGAGRYVYRKPCVTPHDTVLGTYECVACGPTFLEWEDQECGRERAYMLRDITPPQTIAIS